LKIDAKRVRRTLYWFAAELMVLAIFLLFLTYKPKGYQAAVPDASGRVSPYLTHQIGQDFYNNMQLGEPFELVIEEAGINSILASGEWGGQFGDAQASLPVIRLGADKLRLMTSVYLSGMEFVATVDITASIDEQGLLHASLESVKVGAVPVTIVARTVAKKMYMEQTAGLPKDDLRVLVAGAIFNDQPFEPKIDIDNKVVKIGKIRIEEGKAVVGFIPIKRR
jgi:hypothetical protein